MTNGDRIRSMTDEELAELFFYLISSRDHELVEKLRKAGISADLYEIPAVSKQRHLNWLESEYQGEGYNDRGETI